MELLPFDVPIVNCIYNTILFYLALILNKNYRFDLWCANCCFKLDMNIELLVRPSLYQMSIVSIFFRFGLDIEFICLSIILDSG